MTPAGGSMEGQGTVLVTGGTGLLGSYLLRELLRHDQPVKALYRERKPLLLTAEEDARIHWVKGDVLDPVLLAEEMAGVSEVYHCAGVVSFNPSRRDHMFKINVEGTANVVNAAIAAGVRKLCHVSSVSALGRKRDHETVTESSKWSPEANLSNYGESKFLSEMEVWRGDAEGLDTVVVNPVIILGYGDWETGSAATFKSAYDEFPWYTEGVSGFVDAEDVADVMYRLMKSEVSGERFIVSGESMPYRELFTRMAEAFGKKPPHRRVNGLMAGIVWRWEKVKGLLTGKDPMLTKETAETARRTVHFDNTKILKALPGFRFKPIIDSIQEHCREYSVKAVK
jgi:nucleoside-diphosphate-sugar epimerase